MTTAVDAQPALRRRPSAGQPTRQDLPPFPTSTFIDALRAVAGAPDTRAVAGAPDTRAVAGAPDTRVEQAPAQDEHTTPAGFALLHQGQADPDEWSPAESNPTSMTVDAFVAVRREAQTEWPDRTMETADGPASGTDDAHPARRPPAHDVDLLTPAGWYPDPAGRFDVRYWDGHAWTNHVMTEEKPTLDAARADGIDKLWLDAVVDLGLMRKSRVVVTNEIIRFEDRTVMLRDVTAISWSGMGGRGFVDARLSCTLWTHDSKFRLEFAIARFERSQLARLRRAFHAISASVAHNVEPRLVDDRLAALENGEMVHVGPITLRTSGITVARLGRKRHFDWGEVAVTDRRDGLAIVGFGTGEVLVTLEVPTILRDAVLLPELIRGCVTRFA